KPTIPTKTPAWEKKNIRGIYLSRYQITNNASEETIRNRVRYYKQQGINTIIQGVWGNGCTMYNSIILQQTLGFKSCPNQFQDQWLDWMIDEAQKQNMQIHAYFEKGIKIDKDSPILELAKSRKWLVPGIDKTYPAVEHYVLDVEIPEVANLFRQISSEFVRKYPKINAVQWDDYLGYHADLPGQTDRTQHLTQFVLQMRADIKKANPAVSFDLCHHNPYWGRRYFAADWAQWQLDRVYIQVYNDKNFNEEMPYLEQYGGVAIAETQLHRLKALVENNNSVFNARHLPLNSSISAISIRTS
ncbi:MAG: family 10 glycosylhydrolase, partial [Alkalinema sp. RU_4_3]|nr:family 10 glycosylhydrolase [Alkalinema sp. RU_4_3]